MSSLGELLATLAFVGPPCEYQYVPDDLFCDVRFMHVGYVGDGKFTILEFV
jgi:hypothetical protein